jgi:hypothetical protein
MNPVDLFEHLNTRPTKEVVSEVGYWLGRMEDSDDTTPYQNLLAFATASLAVLSNRLVLEGEGGDNYLRELNCVKGLRRVGKAVALQLKGE